MSQTFIKLEGADELIKALDSLEESIRTRVMKKAVDAGARPIRKRAAQLARKRHGALAKSLAIKTKQYPSGITCAVIGPSTAAFTYVQKGGKLRVRKLKNGEDWSQFVLHRPFKIAHLIEYGHLLRAKGGRPNEPGEELSKSRRRGGRIIGKVPAYPFMRPAADEQGQAAVDIIAQHISQAIMGETA